MFTWFCWATGDGGGSGSESRKGRCWFLHIMLECARSGALRAAELALIFSLTKEAKDGDQRAALPLFEELQSANVLRANDLWTEEEEWKRGSLWDV